MKTLITGVAVMLAGWTLAASPALAQEPAPTDAGATTVWVDGKGQSSFAEKLNKMHAEMAAKGWDFVEIEIYTENGDMKGAFVTYERD